MSATEVPSACRHCRRRSWLLGELSALLDYRCGEPGRLLDTLGLEDSELIEALGGRRRAELTERHAAFAPDSGEWSRPAVCRHDPAFAAGLLEPPDGPAMLYLSRPQQAEQLRARPFVALLSGMRLSEYGLEMASRLSRSLLAAGVGWVALRGGELERCLGRDGGTGAGRLLVSPDGLEAAFDARALISELPAGVSGRRWGRLAAARTAVTLAQAVIVLECPDDARHLAAPRLARARGSPVAAVPGRATSTLAAGPNRLLREGAGIVTDGEQALELLGPLAASPSSEVKHRSDSRLAPQMRELMEAIDRGTDRLEGLLEEGHGGIADVLAGLGELELRGELTRGRGGRYRRTG